VEPVDALVELRALLLETIRSLLDYLFLDDR
jgi:hypothetical protein